MTIIAILFPNAMQQHYPHQRHQTKNLKCSSNVLSCTALTVWTQLSVEFNSQLNSTILYHTSDRHMIYVNFSMIFPNDQLIKLISMLQRRILLWFWHIGSCLIISYAHFKWIKVLNPVLMLSVEVNVWVQCCVHQFKFNCTNGWIQWLKSTLKFHYANELLEIQLSSRLGLLLWCVNKLLLYILCCYCLLFPAGLGSKSQVYRVWSLITICVVIQWAQGCHVDSLSGGTLPRDTFHTREDSLL